MLRKNTVLKMIKQMMLKLSDGKVSCPFEKLLKKAKNKPMRLRHSIDSPVQRERKQEINFAGTVRGEHTLMLNRVYYS